MRLSGQRLEQGELLVRELHLTPADLDPAGQGVHGKVADPNRAPAAADTSAKPPRHPAEQRGVGEGLREILVGARLEPTQPVRFAGPAREDEDGKLGVETLSRPADLSQHVYP